MKLANPLYYPIAVLAGAITLVAGIRVAQLPSVVMLPAAAAIASVGASLLKSREPETFNLDNPELERDLQSVRTSAKILADKANALRLEAAQLLTDAIHIELLASVQYACDRAGELPAEEKLRSSTGVAIHLTKLAESLRRNIQLARQGQDARQAQVVSLSTWIQDSAGVLQELQNKLRNFDLTDSAQTMELRSLSDELSSFQENVDLLVSK